MGLKDLQQILHNAVQDSPTCTQPGRKVVISDTQQDMFFMLKAASYILMHAAETMELIVIGESRGLQLLKK